MSINIEEEYDKIFHYCYYRIRNRQVAEDVTQEVFLHFFKSNYVEQEKGIRYLYVIARNLCIDESRKKKLYEIKQEDEVTDDGIFTEQVIENLYLEQMLAVLSEEERELVVLRFVNEEPVALICEELQISRFSLYRKLNQIKKKLKEWKEESGTYES